MRVIKPDKDGILKAVKALKSGGVIIYPTDTAYALGGRFRSKKVIKRILQIKQRKDKKFTLVSSSLNQVQKFFKLNSSQKILAKKFWPGPISFVVSPQFAIRVPKNKICQKLCQRLGQPLIATSANISGEKTPYSIDEILKQFIDKKNQPVLILDAGKLSKVKPSTLVQIDKNEIKILRAGPIKPIL